MCAMSFIVQRLGPWLFKHHRLCHSMVPWHVSWTLHRCVATSLGILCVARQESWLEDRGSPIFFAKRHWAFAEDALFSAVQLVTARQIATHLRLIYSGQQLCAVHTFLRLSCCSFATQRERAKLENWVRKALKLNFQSRSPASENCAWSSIEKLRECGLQQ